MRIGGVTVFVPGQLLNADLGKRAVQPLGSKAAVTEYSFVVERRIFVGPQSLAENSRVHYELI
jgi:hypothetical protein